MALDDDVAAKARAEREAAEALARKAAHEENAAKIADEKAAIELEEWKAAAASRQRTTELAAEAAELDNIAKQQTVFASATPELKGLERGKTTAPDDVLYSTLLTAKALANAAGLVRKAVKATDRNAYRIFITSDPDLLSRDALHRSTVSRLETLTTLVQEFPDPRSVGGLESGGVLSAAAAAAKLIPGLLELFAANRAITSAAITVDDEQVVTAVAGALAAAEGDDYLLLDDTRFLSGETQVQAKRDELEAAIVELQMKVADETAKPEGDQDSAWLAQAPTVIKAGQDALIALDTVPSGQKMSPLTAAMAIELVRDNKWDFVLVVQPAGGSAAQLISDRALAMKDPIYIAGAVALSYRLIRPDTSQVVAAGVVAGSAELKGTVGSTIDLTGLG